MSPTREELSSFIDRELDPAEMSKIAAEIERSPDLQNYVDQQERLIESLQAVFAPLMEQPVPEKLIHSAATAPVSLRMRMRNLLLPRSSARAGTILRFAVPATALLLGLFVGIGVERSATSEFAVSPVTGQVIARADLAQVLDSQLASEPQSGIAQIGISFRSKTGDACRTFGLAGTAAHTDGVACHHAGEWQVGALVSGAKTASATNYQLAGSEMPAAIRAAVEAQISGEPFDSAAELRARDRGWQ
jgi:hypothetical protein